MTNVAPWCRGFVRTRNVGESASGGRGLRDTGLHPARSYLRSEHERSRRRSGFLWCASVHGTAYFSWLEYSHTGERRVKEVGINTAPWIIYKSAACLTAAVLYAAIGTGVLLCRCLKICSSESVPPPCLGPTSSAPDRSLHGAAPRGATSLLLFASPLWEETF